MAKIVIGAAIVVAGVVAIVATGGTMSPLVATWWAESLTFAAVSMGASMLLGGISEKLQVQHGVSAQVVVRQPAAPCQIVYGRARIGGVFTYLSVTEDKKWLNMVCVHAAHPVHAINAFWLDGRRVYFANGQFGSDDGNTHTDPSGNDYNFHGDVWITYRLGNETLPAFQDLHGWDSNWPTNAYLQGHCCSFIRCKYDQNLWPNGYPQIKVDIAGKSDIYDPRSNTHGYSENTALCLADVLVNQDFGLQCNYSTEIDEAQLIAAANLCDEAVPLAVGSTEPRYAANGTFDTSMDPGSILKNMAASGATRVVCTGGLWRIFPAAWIAPTISFTDDDFIGPIKWMPKRKYRDLANAARGRFVCPSYPYNQNGPGFPNNVKAGGIFDGQWQSCDIPPYAQDALHGYAFAAHVNCGGPSIAPYRADFGFAAGQVFVGTQTVDRGSVIAIAAPMPVYQSQRYGNFTYTLNANPNASVIVRLHFADLFWSTPNTRVFNVFVNGQVALANFDVAAIAGGSLRAVIRDIPATVDQFGHIVISTQAVKDVPIINAIEILPPVPDANLAADNNTRLWMDVSLPYTISVAEAQRTLKINLARIRQQGMGTIQVNLKGLQVSALDVIQISHSRFGWVNKTFEVTAWHLGMQQGDAGSGTGDASGSKGGDGPLLYVEMDIQEMIAPVYSWSTAEELGIEDNPSPVSPGVGLISQAALYPVTVGNRNSSVVGGVSPLSSSDVGTSCDITIAAWALQTGTRVVNYNSGVIHGAGYATKYYIYASDANMLGGSVPYFATSNFSTVTSDQAYVYVDYVVTPASGSTPTGGGGGGGGGVGGGPSQANEFGNVNVTGTTGGGGATLTYNIQWSATNVPSGNTVGLQASTDGINWTVRDSVTGSTGSRSTTYTISMPSNNARFRVIDITSGFVIG